MIRLSWRLSTLFKKHLCQVTTSKIAKCATRFFHFIYFSVKKSTKISSCSRLCSSCCLGIRLTSGASKKAVFSGVQTCSPSPTASGRRNHLVFLLRATCAVQLDEKVWLRSRHLKRNASCFFSNWSTWFDLYKLVPVEAWNGDKGSDSEAQGSRLCNTWCWQHRWEKLSVVLKQPKMVVELATESGSQFYFKIQFKNMRFKYLLFEPFWSILISSYFSHCFEKKSIGFFWPVWTRWFWRTTDEPTTCPASRWTALTQLFSASERSSSRSPCDTEMDAMNGWYRTVHLTSSNW